MNRKRIKEVRFVLGKEHFVLKCQNISFCGLYTDTVTVDGVKELYYTFKNLEQKSYYAFAVKAVSSDAESAFSEEVVVYTDESSAITMPDNDKYGLDNAPVSIFTIDGRKVENMNVPGIYIIKKGNSVRKVATY